MLKQKNKKIRSLRGEVRGEILILRQISIRPLFSSSEIKLRYTKKANFPLTLLQKEKSPADFFYKELLFRPQIKITNYR